MLRAFLPLFPNRRLLYCFIFCSCLQVYFDANIFCISFLFLYRKICLRPQKRRRRFVGHEELFVAVRRRHHEHQHGHPHQRRGRGRLWLRPAPVQQNIRRQQRMSLVLRTHQLRRQHDVPAGASGHSGGLPSALPHGRLSGQPLNGVHEPHSAPPPPAAATADSPAGKQLPDGGQERKGGPDGFIPVR